MRSDITACMHLEIVLWVILCHYVRYMRELMVCLPVQTATLLCLLSHAEEAFVGFSFLMVRRVLLCCVTLVLRWERCERHSAWVQRLVLWRV